jgi:hypothetical protein
MGKLSLMVNFVMPPLAKNLKQQTQPRGKF